MLFTCIINIFFIFFLLFISIIHNHHILKKNNILLQGRTMGTTWMVVLPKQEIYKEKYIKNIIYQKLYQDEKFFSSWIKDSIVSNINKSKKKTLYPLNLDMMNTISIALYIGHKTSDALDITINQLIKKWGFSSQKTSKLPISIKIIKKKLSLTGLKNIQIIQNKFGFYFNKKLKKLKIDLSTIGEGIAVDHISSILKKENINNFMISVGGAILVHGKSKNIGIAKPTDKNSIIHISLSIRDLAISTSGNYQNYYTYNKKNISHIINPFTGNPIKHHLVSVSIISKHAIDADAWDTGLMVLGFNKAKKTIIKEKLSVCLITKKNNKIFTWFSPIFKQLLM